MSTVMAVANHYCEILSGLALEIFTSLLSKAQVIKLGEREALTTKCQEESWTKEFLSQGLLFPTNEPDRFLIFESQKDTLDFLVANFKSIDLGDNFDARYLRRVLGSLECSSTMIGASPRFVKACQAMICAAKHDVGVLLLGETGVGKELFAENIHALSPRKDKPLVAVNCSAIPTELWESELFGHEKGSFTGAHATKHGKMELADGGTLFLDEIGDMSPAAQTKLLRVLDNKSFERVGGTRTIKVNVRIIAATNADLQKKMREGNFRKDLFYRLEVVTIVIPPLRDRKEDIPALTKFYLERLGERYGKSISGLAPEQLSFLTNYSWPGNVRELINMLTKALVVESGNRDNLISIPNFPHSGLSVPVPSKIVKKEEGEISLKQVAAKAAEAAEKEVVLRILEETDWNRKETARRLKVCYKVILNKLKKWGIDPPYK